MTGRFGLRVLAYIALALIVAGCGGSASNSVFSSTATSSGTTPPASPSPSTSVSPSPSPSATAVPSPSPIGIVVGDAGNNRFLIFPGRLAGGLNFTPDAQTVIGQPNFTTNTAATTQTGFNDPRGAGLDPDGNLWLSDHGNSRILEFKPPFTNGMAASAVLGQTNFTSGLANQGNANPAANTLVTPEISIFDSRGNMWVADPGNNRVVMFAPPFTTNMNASLVLGQSSFTTGAAPVTPSASTLNGPSGITFDASGNLWVAEEHGNRVVEFVSPFRNGMNASLVLGQVNFTTNNSSATQSTFNFSNDVKVDSSGNVIVNDNGNNRVLLFSPPLSNGMNASIVLGQSNFTNNSANQGAATSINSMSNNFRLALDGDDLYVTDQDNNRVLLFSEPLTTDMNATDVLGQINAMANAPSTTQIGFDSPAGILATQ